jgi:hypothetical protein
MYFCSTDRFCSLPTVGFAKSVKLEAQEEPQKEIDRQKKETDDLEAARQKNRKLFHP